MTMRLFRSRPPRFFSATVARAYLGLALVVSIYCAWNADLLGSCLWLLAGLVVVVLGDA